MKSTGAAKDVDEGAEDVIEVQPTTLYAPSDLLEFYSLESVRRTGKMKRRNDLMIEALEHYRGVLESE